ncbi:hypothetical protein [Endozoicomonas sp.]|uniref:hypothetical protein n=1 Tax=Endozoicomonas sp. TaxID=1892382 RepID=UPI0028879F82|nr:hypothetical protein [Endozoicomonas sp.]
MMQLLKLNFKPVYCYRLTLPCHGSFIVNTWSFIEITRGLPDNCRYLDRSAFNNNDKASE